MAKSSARKLAYMAEYQKRPENVAKRVGRNKARRLMIAKHGKAALRGKDVDHKDRNPTNNSHSNLRIQTKKENRGRNK
ncbi:TPA: HNH endonuclease [Photobacterium damselae]